MKKVITTILVLILVFLLGWIGYDLFIKNTEEPIVGNEIENLKVLLEESEYLTEEDKIDSSMPFVYEIAPTYELETVEGVKEKKFINEFKTTNEQVGEYSIPYINIKSDETDIYNDWLKMATLAVNQAKDSIYDKEETYLNYNCVLYDDIYSIEVRGSIYGYEFVKGINFDLTDKKFLELNNLKTKLNIDHFALNELVDNNVNLIQENNTIDNKGPEGIANFNSFLSHNRIGNGYDPIFGLLKENKIDFEKIVEKKCIFNDKYQGYVLSIYPFINNDGTIDIDKSIEWRNHNISPAYNTCTIKNDNVMLNFMIFVENNNKWIYKDLLIK